MNYRYFVSDYDGSICDSDRDRMDLVEKEVVDALNDQVAQIAELETERDTLRAAIRRICHDVWGYDDPDGGDVQDYLVEVGILIEVPASEAVREEYDCETMFTPRWNVPSARIGRRP